MAVGRSNAGLLPLKLGWSQGIGRKMIVRRNVAQAVGVGAMIGHRRLVDVDGIERLPGKRPTA